MWVIGSFAICPCHLPLTLALLGTVLGGTALGALLHQHLVIAGLVIAGVWVWGTWRGLGLLQARGAACPVPGPGRSRLRALREFVGRSRC
jgi:hypothetical protein